MTGKEFIQRLKKLARLRSVEFRLESKRGKGSHVTVYLDEKFAIIPDLKKDLKTGTLNAILKQLGLTKDDL